MLTFAANKLAGCAEMDTKANEREDILHELTDHLGIQLVEGPCVCEKDEGIQTLIDTNDATNRAELFMSDFGYDDAAIEMLEEAAALPQADKRTFINWCNAKREELKIEPAAVGELDALWRDVCYYRSLVNVPAGEFGIVVNGHMFTKPEQLIEQLVEGRGLSDASPQPPESDLHDLGTVSESVIRQL